MTLPVRRRVAGGRSRRSRSRRIAVDWARLVGVVAIFGAVVSGYWLLSDPRFAVDESRIDISGLVHTNASVVRERLQLPATGSTNVFRLRTAAMERALAELPAVEEANVRAILPDSLVVTVKERVPLFVWQTDAGAFLVDAAGVLVASVEDASSAVGALPLVDDRRDLAESPAPGMTIDPIDLDAILRLAAVTPERLGSDTEELQLTVDEEEGYAIDALPDGWRAVFGHYTPTLRSTDMIDAQVQCLRSMLATGEDAVETVYLSLGDDRCGTFVPAATPTGGRGTRGEGSPGEAASPSPED